MYRRLSSKNMYSIFYRVVSAKDHYRGVILASRRKMQQNVIKITSNEKFAKYRPKQKFLNKVSSKVIVVKMRI